MKTNIHPLNSKNKEKAISNSNQPSLPPLPKATKQWKINLLPDESRLLCFSQVGFVDNSIDVLFFEGGIKYVELVRSPEYRLSSEKKLREVCGNIKCLNPEIKKDTMFVWLTDIVENHFLDKFLSETINKIIDWVFITYEKGNLKEYGRKRKLIFRPGNNLTTIEKKQIIGKYCGKSKSISSEDIYLYLEEFQGDESDIHTYESISNFFQCSRATIIKNFPIELTNLYTQIFAQKLITQPTDYQ